MKKNMYLQVFYKEFFFLSYQDGVKTIKHDCSELFSQL